MTLLLSDLVSVRRRMGVLWMDPLVNLMTSWVRRILRSVACLIRRRRRRHRRRSRGALSLVRILGVGCITQELEMTPGGVWLMSHERRWRIICTRWAALRLAGERASVDASTHGSRPVILNFGRLSPSPSRVFVFAMIVVVISSSLPIPSAHAHITSNPDTASLLSNNPTELCALSQTRELLSAKYQKVGRLDLHPEIERASSRLRKSRGDHLRIRCVGVLVLILFSLLIEVEGQLVATLVADRQVGKEEIASLLGTVKIRHARDRHPRQHRRLVGSRSLNAAVSHNPSMLKSCIEKEVGVVEKSNVL
jgi:hypothetical protein